MNKKGQSGLSALGIALMVELFLFIVGMTVINLLKPNVIDARNSLDCSSNTISDGNKIACLGADLVIPYFIVTIISATGGIITARLLI